MKLPQLCFMAILWAGVACGEQIVIVLDQSTLAGQPGQTLSFFGTVENTTAMELFI